MQILKLDMYQALALAVFMLLIGRELAKRVAFLRQYCIPAPVIGGLIFAVLHLGLRTAGIVEFELDDTLQKVFMTAFFLQCRLHGGIRNAEKRRNRRGQVFDSCDCHVHFAGSGGRNRSQAVWA